MARRCFWSLCTWLTIPLALGAFCASVAQARGVDAACGLECQRFFGGQTVSMPISHPPALDESLVLRAQLLQRTSALAAPIGPPIELTISRHTGWRSALEVPLPSVRRESDFELRTEVRRTSEADWAPAGRIPLRLYPADLMEPLRRWAERHELRVEDEGGGLAAFLRDHDVPFQSPGAAARRAKGPSITLYAGRSAERAARDPESLRGAGVIFRERDAGVPHLVVLRSGERALIGVEMRLLGRVATEPRAQQTLTKIFELLEARITGGESR